MSSSSTGGSGVAPSGCTEPDKTICSSALGRHCDYTYEFWRDTGGGCMVVSADGFSMEWNDENNVLARKGVRPGSGSEVFSYEADYSADGTSFLGIYGWTRNPLVEYYIVDGWGGNRPPGRGDRLGSVESDGGTYDIYRTQQVDKPSIEGTTTFDQYWSVRTSERAGGTITVGNHFDAWESNGMNMGSLYEVSLVVEGYKSSGSADVRMSMK
ncbi:MAG: glycoside hydrolase family 11 protein [Polyangiaceae bacterium]|nr:glycoside hydrolase family 11 protein [Polyangiaceae bacterium]